MKLVLKVELEEKELNKLVGLGGIPDVDTLLDVFIAEYNRRGGLLSGGSAHLDKAEPSAVAAIATSAEIVSEVEASRPEPLPTPVADGRPVPPPAAWDVLIRAFASAVLPKDRKPEDAPVMVELRQGEGLEASYLVIGGDPTIPNCVHLATPREPFTTFMTSERMEQLEHAGTIQLSSAAIIRAIESQGSSIFGDLGKEINVIDGDQQDIVNLFSSMAWGRARKELIIARNQGKVPA